MAFAVIAGRTYAVLTTGAGDGPPEKIGTRRRTWNGGIRSGEQAQKLRTTLPLAPILDTAYQLLLADTKLSQEVVCSGAFTNGVAIIAVVDISSAAYYRPIAGGPLYRVCSLDITEA